MSRTKTREECCPGINFKLLEMHIILYRLSVKKVMKLDAFIFQHSSY